MSNKEDITRQDVVRLCRSGISPGEIAEKLGTHPQKTLAYLEEMVGRGKVHRSDIFFTVPKDVREAVLNVLGTNPIYAPEYIKDLLKDSGLAVKLGDVLAVVRYRDTQEPLGDMYEDIREIETNLHTRIRRVLERNFGQDESGWWRKGIPEDIRKECQSRREEDKDGPSDPYCYTNLIDLWKIIKTQWAIFQTELSVKIRTDKNKLEHDIQRLNVIRNIVMHPVRGRIPTEDDFDFVREFKARSLGNS
jgi:hypothetical protein